MPELPWKTMKEGIKKLTKSGHAGVNLVQCKVGKPASQLCSQPTVTKTIRTALGRGVSGSLRSVAHSRPGLLKDMLL